MRIRGGVIAGLLAVTAEAQALEPVTNDGRSVGVHDPSTVVVDAGTYWLFATGRGIKSWHSSDLEHWYRGPEVFESMPDWVKTEVPGYNARRGDAWAPDVIRVGNRWLLYYSVSVFGQQTSAIGLASNSTLDSRSSAYKWRDEGPVIVSKRGDDYNAIDPALILDSKKRLWMTFGSFWKGIFLVELAPLTGKLRQSSARPIRLASNSQIEAAYLHEHDGWFYLFVNWGLCCRGADSTYEIRVGRSREITGPYRDHDGKAMTDGGGTLLLGTSGRFIGPGHAGIVTKGGVDWFSFHFYDGDNHGQPTLGLRKLTWDADGWPVVEANAPADP